MTLEQAQEQRDQANTLLTELPIEYVVIKNFVRYVETYDIIAIPSKYNTEYGAATFEQSQAFGLVSTTTNPTSEIDFVTAFDNAAALNPVLSVYLGL